MKTQFTYIALLLVAFTTGCASYEDSASASSEMDARNVEVIDGGELATNDELEPVKPKAVDRSTAFTISPAAAVVLKNAADAEQTEYVRAGCRVGGCSGFIYELNVVDDFDESKDQVFVSGDAKVIVDKDSLVLMDGVTLDYVSTSKVSGFEFNRKPSTDQTTTE